MSKLISCENLFTSMKAMIQGLGPADKQALCDALACQEAVADLVSTNPDNALQLGTDNKLFVSKDVDVLTAISDDPDNALTEGSDDKLYVPRVKMEDFISSKAGQIITMDETGKLYAQGQEGQQGPQGDPGEKGDTGRAGTMRVGNVRSVAYETGASVVNVGTPTDAILDFDIPRGQKGDKGEKGDAGVPEGGTRGQVLVKASDTDSDVMWADTATLPGGTEGQVLAKRTGADQDLEWKSLKEVPEGGAEGQVLAKNSEQAGDYGWVDVADIALPSGGTDGQVLVKDEASEGGAKWDDINALPSGGTTGQVLTKSSDAEGEAEWANAPSGIPTGGLQGQALVKLSGDDIDVGWQNILGLPTGGTNGQILVKGTGGDGSATWKNASQAVLPVGGDQGQVLAKKTSADGEVEWVNHREVPAGGLMGQVLMKESAESGDTTWASIRTVPIGGSEGQVLKRNTSGYGWANDESLPSGATEGDVLIHLDGVTGWGNLRDSAQELGFDFVPEGGTEGQVLVKTADGSEWQDSSDAVFPEGGTQGQVLKKTADGEEWADDIKLPSGGSTGQMLVKKTNADGDSEWIDNLAVPSNGELGDVLVKTVDGYAWKNVAIPTLDSHTFNASGQTSINVQLPANARRIRVHFDAVNLGTGTLVGSPKIKLGTANGVLSSGYKGTGGNLSDVSLSTDSFSVGAPTGSSSGATINGYAILEKSGADNIWSFIAFTGRSNVAQFNEGAGSVVLPDTISQLVIEKSNPAFVSGTITVVVETGGSAEGSVVSTIIYPNGGTAESPANVTTSQRIVMDNPFPGYFVDCEAQVFLNGEWGKTNIVVDYLASPATWRSYGVDANQLGNQIIIRTGMTQVTNNPSHSLGPLSTHSIATSLPCRVIVTRLGKMPTA